MRMLSVNLPRFRLGFGNTRSFVGADVRFEGRVDCAGAIRIDGAVRGDVAAGSVTIGRTANIDGNVSADSALVEGRVMGQIKARSVILGRTAKVTGDVLHGTLVVEPGAAVDGSCRQLAEAAPRPPVATLPARPDDDPTGPGLFAGSRLRVASVLSAGVAALVLGGVAMPALVGTRPAAAVAKPAAAAVVKTTPRAEEMLALLPAAPEPRPAAAAAAAAGNAIRRDEAVLLPPGPPESRVVPAVATTAATPSLDAKPVIAPPLETKVVAAVPEPHQPDEQALAVAPAAGPQPAAEPTAPRRKTTHHAKKARQTQVAAAQSRGGLDKASTATERVASGSSRAPEAGHWWQQWQPAPAPALLHADSH